MARCKAVAIYDGTNHYIGDSTRQSIKLVAFKQGDSFIRKDCPVYRLPAMEYRELDVLTEKFNSIMGRIEGLIVENKQYENEKRELEISALQAQINPHFIYNSLTTIKWMASMAHASNVCQGILELNNVLQPVFPKLEFFGQ